MKKSFKSLHCAVYKQKKPDFNPTSFTLIWMLYLIYPRNEINTPAATAEPITPEILLAIQYCRT